jgi:RNA polymerase sigma-70 factor (ECF subfamily)
MTQEYEKIITGHRDRIYRLCYSYCDRVEDVQDLFQEALINVWKSLPKFRGESSVSTWIYRITINTALMHVRKDTTRRIRFTEYQPEFHDTSDETGRGSENAERLRKAIAQLPAADRMIMALVLEDSTYQEIAEVTGLTVNHVGVKINRIKEKIMKVLSHEK